MQQYEYNIATLFIFSELLFESLKFRLIWPVTDRAEKSAVYEQYQAKIKTTYLLSL